MRARARCLVLGLLLAGILSGCLSGSDAAEEDLQTAVKIQGSKASVSVYPGMYKFDGQYSQVLVEGIYKARPPERVFIKSAIDGVDIEIGIHRPAVPEGVKVPVIAEISPYHRVSRDVTTLGGMMLFLHDNFLPHGYAIAAVSVRGTGNSGGCMDLMGRKENADASQAVTWLGTQPWSSGNVAMTGVSYPGSTPWSVAGLGNPHLKTIVPISGVPDIYGLMFQNGSAESRGPILLNLLYYTYGPGTDDVRPTNTSSPLSPYPRTAQHRIEGAICPESWAGFAAALYSGTYGERDPAGWWAERNRKPLVEANYKGSILSVQGLQDWNVEPTQVIPWVDELEKKGFYTKQMLGQWGHASPDRPPYVTPNGQRVVNPNVRFDWAEILLHWYDYWLKGDTTNDLGPRVQVQDQTKRWRNEEHYPPHDAMWTTKHLAAGNRLSDQTGPAGGVLLTPAPLLGPASGSLRSFPGYSADFSTPVLEKDLLIAGLARLHVTVTPHGPTGHLAAWLYDVDEKGAETRIGWAQINLLFADGTERARPITPNQPLLTKMEFQPMDAYVKSGHKLLLRVWEYQQADRLPSIPPEPVTLNFGGNMKSVLELPILERGPDAYFQPPMPPK